VNKCWAILVLTLFCSSLVLASLPLDSNDQTGRADVAYVLKDSSKASSNVINELDSLGLSYEVIDDSEISSTDFSKFSMLLVWDGTLIDDELLPVGEMKSLVANTYYLEDWGIADYAGSQISTGYIKVKILKDSEVSEGFSVPSSLSVYGSSGVELHNLPYPVKRADGIENVVSTDSYKEYPVIGTINTGDELYLGGNALSRIAFFGITESEHWNSDGKKLFRNTVSWVMSGSDNDGDGYFYDDDCDDSDASVWQNVLGYTDNDEDGFGAGSIIEVCSGESLPVKFSSFGGDCDDSDVSYGPNSNDVYKNCVNDAPIVEDLLLSVNETGLVSFEVNASDPEGDVLSYEIDDVRFSKAGNVFSWQTENGDGGTHFFDVNVSDGEFFSVANVEIRVLDRAPVWSDIPAISWLEDENTSLALGSFCNDPEGDDLVFFVNSTSNNNGIIISGNGSGIVNLSVVENWNGDDWVIFSAYDGASIVNSNNVSLSVLAVNDVPDFVGLIDNVSFEEDSSLNDVFDLNDYFVDVDGDGLSFGVEGNHDVDVLIVNGVVSFSSDNDWFGLENIVFFATDGIDKIYSNAIEVTVLDQNEKPEFEVFTCARNIDEDVSYSCELNASDEENDDIWFNVVASENMDCEIDGNVLSYISGRNYNGNGSCDIRVSDKYGFNEMTLDFEILSVNDAPSILSYTPLNSVRLVERNNQRFEIEVDDVDGDSLDISWSLDSLVVGSGNSYLFNEGSGSYSVGVEVSDGKFSANRSWNVFVGDISEFSCGEVDGFLFNAENEICTGEILGVIEGSCCSVLPNERPPEFSDVDSTDAVLNNGGIVVSIRDPNNGDNFELGEEIEVEVRLENNLGEDMDFDVEVYFYDLSDDDVVEDDEDKNVDVDDGRSESVEFTFDISDKVDTDNDYAIYARVIDEDGNYYGDDYVKIGVEREEEDVVIKDFVVGASEGICGDYVWVEVLLKNMGSEEQDDVVFILENEELGIYEMSEELELEEYDEKDRAKLNFGFIVPEDVSSGEYELKGTVSYAGGKKSSKVVDFAVDECFEASVVSSVEDVQLSSVRSYASSNEIEFGLTTWILIGAGFWVGLVLIFFILKLMVR
jgi:hypothetical protein